MQPESASQPLSLIPTLWSLVLQARDGPADAVHQARQRLLEHYGGAVQRYLRKVLRDADRADDIFQDFAVRLLRGDLRGANPERGRFRNFVKGTLFHLIAYHYKQQQKWPRQLPGDGGALVDFRETLDFDGQFTES